MQEIAAAGLVTIQGFCLGFPSDSFGDIASTRDSKPNATASKPCTLNPGLEPSTHYDEEMFEDGQVQVQVVPRGLRQGDLAVVHAVQRAHRDSEGKVLSLYKASVFK